MSHIISYDNAVQFANTITAPSTLTVTEADLFVVKDTKYLPKSQLTIYEKVTLGGVASATFFYYLSNDGGTTWYPVSLYNTSTGELTQRSAVIDSGTYAKSGISYAVDEVQMGATLAFKVTGKSATGTPAYSIAVMGRDN